MESNQKVRICVPVCESTIGAARQAIARATEVGDLVEVRLDCLASAELESDTDALQDLLGELAVPVILTLRPKEQGGRRELDRASRHEFLNLRHYSPQPLLHDVELDLALEFNSIRSSADVALDWNRVICSHHDFAGVPPDLDQIYERMSTTPARILKVAIQADDVTDCIPIFDLLLRARRENREVIAIAMGAAGLATRILGPSRGAFLTYGALEHESATAPGQTTARELRTLYRIHKIDRHTQIMGLAGLPVAHSASPHIHNAAFESAGVNAVYIPFAVRDINSFIERMVHPRTREIDWNLRGLSVTAPHKNAVMNCLDWIDPAAKDIGAVNTIVVENNALSGYNTDASAFIHTLTQRFGGLKDGRFALIGAGGAASAALWGLRREGANVTIFARDDQKARVLAERFGAARKSLASAQFGGFDVVINATTMGMSGSLVDATPATAEQLRGARLACDMVYNPVETRFLREARTAGCETLGGLGMLIAQAAEQFMLWTGVEAPQELMQEAALQTL